MTGAGILGIAQRILEAVGLPRAPLEPITVGLSGAHVLRGGGVVLKIVAPGQPHVHAELQHELAALRWLQGRVRVPAVLWSGTIDGHSALAMEELRGRPLYEHPTAEHEAGLATISRTLAALHALPPADCPLDQRTPHRIARARAHVAAGIVDEGDFDDEHTGMTAPALFAKMAAAPTPECAAPVVTHGDACFPNFILADDGTVGLVDLGRAGVGDPAQDFALFLRSAAFNFPALDARAILMREYPLHTLDDERLAFFRLLDEFY